jgi:hypothetical protein
MTPLPSSALDFMPPVAQLLLRNLRPSTSFDDAHKQIRQLLPDLREQADSSVAEALNRGDETDVAALDPLRVGHGTFVINLAGALDPFSDADKCGAWRCRIRTAEQLGRLVALYADVAYVHDPFTMALAFEERWTRASTVKLMENLSLLSTLTPLLAAGVLKFTVPVVAVCTSCKSELLRRIGVAAGSVIRASAKEITYAAERNMIAVYTDRFDYTDVVYRSRITKQMKAQINNGTSVRTLGQRAYKAAISRTAHEILLSMSAALPIGATTLIGSRANLLTIRAMGKRPVYGTELASWEASRATDIPWIKDLTVEQSLELRSKAASALPRFRMRMATGLADSAASAPGKVQNIVDELREESVEVSAELRALNFPRGERFRNVSGSLALTMFLYGFAADFVPAAAALGGLLSALALVHQDSRKAHQERDRLEARPGFVLLKAREIFEHAE